MSVRCAWVRGFLAAGLVAGGSVSAQVAGPAAKPLPELGAPPIAEPTTNVSRPSRRDGLKYLEEELGKSLQPFSSKSPLDGVLAPQFRPAPQPLAPSRRSREASDRDKRWGSLDREATESDRLAEAFKLLGRGQSDKKQKALEEFYEKLNRPRSGRSSADSFKDDSRSTGSQPGRFDDPDSRDDDRTPSGIREKERSLREKLTGGEDTERIYNPGGGRSLLADWFTTEERGPTREEIQTHKDNLERYREVLGYTPPAKATLQDAPSLPQAAAPPSSLPGYGGLGGLGSSTRLDSLASTPGGISRLLNPAVLPDPTARVLNQWNPLYEPPRPEPPRPLVQPLAPPSMEVPRRRF